ncbi:MAG: ABC transporter substrate-binding protein [Nitrospiraceae bacterium]|nr:MAG: ABC transporter substrate-binding protein [Nitrospiraceae bacterium]
MCLTVLLIAGLLPVGSRAAETGQRTFVDDLDRKVILTHAPRRIVSLAPSITETLFAIGLGERVVGVTQFCDYPPEAQSKPKIGYMHPNLEAIVALEPDLILAPRELLRVDILGKLEQLQIPTYVLDATTVASILVHIQTLGQILGASANANDVVRRMQRQIEEIKARTARLSRPRVLYALNSEPLITIGPGSYLHEAIEIAGGSNVAARARVAYPRLSMEAVLQEDPEVILFPTGRAEGIAEGEEERWQRWTTLSAIRLKQLRRVPNELLNRPGPRIVQGIEALARAIHPEAFDERRAQ